MDQHILSPEELREAVMHLFVTRLRDVGKIKIQKLVYFLQEAYEVPLACKFYLHYYGPYSDEVESGISNLRLMGYVDVQPDAAGYGFHVTPALPAEPGWATVEENARAPLDQVIDRFGSMDAAQLELAATIHFIKAKFRLKKSDVMTSVRLRKPKFPNDVISSAYDDLVSTGLISG